MIEKLMRLRLFRNLATYVILLLYVLIPMLDSMVCASCMESAPLQCETSIGYLLAPRNDVVSASHDGAQSKTPLPDEYAAKSFCSICANFLTGVEVSSQHVHASVAQWDGPCAVPPLSVLYRSINKPPQNIFG